MKSTLHTPLCELLNIKHPVMSAGMNSVSMHELVAAVSNAGGIGTIGGLNMTPTFLRKEIALVKSLLHPGMPFGVDLALPQVGGSARKTNKDYTKGQLPELIDVIIEEKASLFVSAVGIPPSWVIEKLHEAGIPIMNMCGLPYHAQKALDAGIDIICAQGTEAGGHTGDVSTMVLVPQCVDIVRNRVNYFGKEVLVVAAGGIYDGKGLAASLALGASGVWVGTRFIASDEASCSKDYKEMVVNLDSNKTIKTLVVSGRPLRLAASKYIEEWEDKPGEIKELVKNGIVPLEKDLKDGKFEGKHFFSQIRLVGQACGGVKSIKSAKDIVEDMVSEASQILESNRKFVRHSKL